MSSPSGVSGLPCDPDGSYGEKRDPRLDTAPLNKSERLAQLNREVEALLTEDEPTEPHQPAAARYRKRPVVIDAIQFTWVAIDAAVLFTAGAGRLVVNPSGDTAMVIDTLEGDMTAVLGDYIIRGVAGELYPCKPDIFNATYDLATDTIQNNEGAEPSTLHGAPKRTGYERRIAEVNQKLRAMTMARDYRARMANNYLHKLTDAQLKLETAEQHLVELAAHIQILKLRHPKTKLIDNAARYICENGLDKPQPEKIMDDRITQEDIDEAIDTALQVHHGVVPNTTTTICAVTLVNGFTVIGTAAAVSAENFDEAIGRSVSLGKVRDKLWELLGWQLKQNIYEIQQADMATRSRALGEGGTGKPYTTAT